MRRLNITLLGLFAANSLFAQVKIMEESFNATGVSNEGLVVGFYDQNAPYFLWHTDSNKMVEIGGVSPGDGIGGQPQFSADGNYLSGTMWTNWTFPKEWEKHTLTDCPYTCNAISLVPRMDMAIAVGENEEGKGIILSTYDGKDWNASMSSLYGLEAICFLNDYFGITCGKMGVCAYTTTRGTEWLDMDPRPEGSTDKIASYKAVDFTGEEPYYGVIGAELEGGGYTAYQSSNGAESWVATTGVTGIPMCITHTDKAFFMGTKDGQILKSTDQGLTWTKVFQAGGFLQPIVPIYKIKFANENIGLAGYDTIVYRTTDGGNTWSITRIDYDLPNEAKIQDIFWKDEQNAIIVGSLGTAYSSADAGATWTKMEIGNNDNSDLKAVAISQASTMIGGINGNFYYQPSREDANIAGMGRYSIKDNTWTALGNLGFIADNVSCGSGYAISGDGKTVVGLSDKGDIDKAFITTCAHATAWSEENGYIDLGTLFLEKNRSTRANAVNYDGSVIVGWQDLYGPWHSAVWRRNDDGTYNPNEYIAIDPDVSTDVYDNQALEARAVSQDGKWIGGRGSSIATGPLSVSDDNEPKTNQPWIWSQETGLVYLGMIQELQGNDSAMGHVTGINNDGTTAVGFFTLGNYLVAFVWTKEGGMMSINSYLENVMKYDLDQHHFSSIMSMSPNGRYVTGFGINNTTDGVFAYQLDLLYEPTGIRTPRLAEGIATVYPNPVSDVLHIDLPFEGEAQIKLIDVQGRTVMQEKTTAAQNTLSVYDIEAGLYILDVTAQGIHKTCKVRINH